MIYMPVEHIVGPVFNVPFILINILLFLVIYKILPETNPRREESEIFAKTYGAIERDTYRRYTLLSVMSVE